MGYHDARIPGEIHWGKVTGLKIFKGELSLQ